jgi:hypothetical protein
MLSEEDKQRIKEEEIFRLGVQRDIAALVPPAKESKRWWDFLNSAFAIWFLSTIAVTFVGWNYALWQSSQNNAEQIRKIDNEVLGRLEATLFYSRHESVFFIANHLLLAPGQDRMIEPEFANRNLKSLLVELKSRAPASEWEDINKAELEVRYIESTYLNKELTGQEYSDFINRLQTIRNGRYWPSKMMGRHYTSFYEIALFWVWLVLVSILVLYGVYKFFRWIWNMIRKAIRGPRKERKQARKTRSALTKTPAAMRDNSSAGGRAS